MIRTQDLTARLWGLNSIGISASGTTRLAWTEEVAAADRWFEREAHDAGLRVERDPAGNLWACPAAPPPWWGVGSHLDSVRSGGIYDGALGVAAGFEVARIARVPIAVISFADEEGARFNTPTFGSRALAGRLDLTVLDRVDDDNIALKDAMRVAGVDPDRVGEAPEWLSRLRGFLELHIDQSREVAELGVPAAPVSSLAARIRVRAEFTGRADHSGTTPMGDRSDALAAAARLIVAATDVAHPMRATATRIEVEPNAQSTVPARVQLWLDARAPTPTDLDAWRDALSVSFSPDTGVKLTLTEESRSDGVEFDPAVRASLGRACEAVARPVVEVVCFAGHDAGILAERIPAGMLLVRNERGVSHAPEEDIAVSDAAWGAQALVRALEDLE